MAGEFQPISISDIDRVKTGIDKNGQYDYYFFLSSPPTPEWQAVFDQQWKKHVTTIGAACVYADKPRLRVHSSSVGDAHQVLGPVNEVIGTVNSKFTEFERSVDSIGFGESRFNRDASS
jgi:hypothetical protein